MPIAIAPDHVELAAVVRAFLGEKDALAVARAALDAEDEILPPYWSDMAALGWMGLHLPEEHGGSGFGLLELAIVLEEMGRVVAPGPFLPTVLASAVLAATGSSTQCARWLPGLASGELVAAVGLADELDHSGRPPRRHPPSSQRRGHGRARAEDTGPLDHAVPESRPLPPGAQRSR